MRRYLLPLLLVLLLTGTASAAVSYEIEVRNGDAHINSTFQLYAVDQEVNVFKTTWQLPEDATINRISDTRGRITEYERQDGSVRFSTNSGPKRHRETVTIQYTLPNVETTWKGSLHTVDLQLPGFSDQYSQYDEEDTSLQIRVPEPILGTSSNHGFRDSYNGTVATFAGEGPVNIKVTYTDREGQYDHYILFGEANLSRADAVYPVMNRITGRTVDFRKFAVLVVNGSEYSEIFDPWIAGTYEEAGVIFIKQSETDKDSLTGLVIHEAMHGFNQKPMSWVRTDAALFDEGTAKYVEWVVNTKLGLHQAEIFGEEISWKAPCKEQDGTCRYRLGPRGTPAALWQYYQSSNLFMPSWSPSMSGQLTPELSHRTFGYAYAELFIRQYLLENGPKALHSVYSRFERQEDAATNADTYEKVLEDATGTNLTPCRYQDRDRFRQCLDDVNSMQPIIPANVTINGTQEQIVFNPVEVPKPEDAEVMNGSLSDRLLGGPRSYTDSGFWTGFVDWTLAGLQKFINSVATLWD